MKEQEKGYGEFLWVLIAAILLLVPLLGVVILLLVRDKAPDRKEGLAYEANAAAGDTSEKLKEEHQRELDSIVEEGMLAMSINTTPSGKGTGKDCSVDWLIENPGNQGKLIRVEVYRDGTGEKIYETRATKPGSYAESVPPDANLPVGEYDCATRFYIYRLEMEEYIGQAVVKIKLVIYE